MAEKLVPTSRSLILDEHPWIWVGDWNLLKQFVRFNCEKSSRCENRCERSPPGLSWLKCWPDEQRTPLWDRDHSGSDPRWVPRFLSCCSRMFPERFWRKTVLAGSEEICRVLEKHPKYVTPSDSFLVTLPFVSSDTCVMYSSVIPGTNVFCDWRFLAFSRVSQETAANFRLFLGVSIMRKKEEFDSFEGWIRVFVF